MFGPISQRKNVQPFSGTPTGPKLISRQVFASFNGSGGSVNSPVGTTFAMLRALGPGGGSGNNAGASASGGGGGGGAFANKKVIIGAAVSVSFSAPAGGVFGTAAGGPSTVTIGGTTVLRAAMGETVGFASSVGALGGSIGNSIGDFISPGSAGGAGSSNSGGGAGGDGGVDPDKLLVSLGGLSGVSGQDLAQTPQLTASTFGGGGAGAGSNTSRGGAGGPGAVMIEFWSGKP